MTPGELVRQTRSRHGLSQERLAIRTGTKQSAISRIECDDISPTVGTLQLLLNAMGERLPLTSEALPREYDRLHRRAHGLLSSEQRLALAISWNRLAGRLAEAGKTKETHG